MEFGGGLRVHRTGLRVLWTGFRGDDPARPLRIELSPGATLRFALRSDGCLTTEARVELRTVCGPVRQSAHDRTEVEFARLCAGRAELFVDARAVYGRRVW